MSDTLSRPVIAAVDGSAASLRAVRWAAIEASRRGATLRLLHVCEIPSGYPAGLVAPRALRDALVGQGEERLAQARETAGKAADGVEIETALEIGWSVPVLVKESRGGAMLVLGSRGLGGFTGLLVGSTTVELAGRARCPVVVVRGDGEDPEPAAAGPVLVGVDGSELSEAALEFAFAEAAAHDAELVAVHAWTDLVLETAFPAAAAVFDVLPLVRAAEESLTRRLAAPRERYPDVRVTQEVVRDRPAHALLGLADRARLVVVGTRGRGGFRGLLLGSTSQHLLRHAPCPVAVVRTDAES